MASFYGKVYRYADGVIGVKQVTKSPMSFGIVYKKSTKFRATGDLGHTYWTAEEAQTSLDAFALAHELPEVESIRSHEETEEVRLHKAIEWKEGKPGTIVDSEGNPVASVHWDHEASTIADYMRNVRIIAAAPDMLRILRSMCNKLWVAKNTKDCKGEIREAEKLSAWIAFCEFDSRIGGVS